MVCSTDSQKRRKYTMRYAGIELHPDNDVETFLAAFSHLPVKRYRSVQELKKWYDEMVKILPPT